MMQQEPNNLSSLTHSTADQAWPLSAYEQAQAQQLVAQIVTDSALPQPQARWLGQRLWQQMQQNRFSLSQLRRWLQQKQESLSDLLRYLSPRPHLWRQGGLALGLAAGLTFSSLSQPLLTLAQEPVSNEFQVNTYTTADQSRPSIGVAADGDFVITWQSDGQDGDGDGIYAQRYNAAGTPQGDEFRVNTTTVGKQGSPSVGVAANGGFVITWQSFEGGDTWGIYAQRYDATGTPQGGEFQVYTSSEHYQSKPNIAMADNGDFVIVWASESELLRNEYYIYAQRYDNQGNPQGSKFEVNVDGIRSSPSIAISNEGGFIVAWERYDYLDHQGADVYAQRYDADGILQGSIFQVNTRTTGFQSNPSVGVADDGDFVIAWTDYEQYDDKHSIYAQRYDQEGLAQGAEFRVNTATADVRFGAGLGVATNGDFVIAWSSRNQDRIYAQPYDNQGNPQGTEFQVNSYTTINHHSPTLGMAADGDFVITWSSSGQDGDGWGIYARRY